jgi:ADP-heptose:LPS heptosyltransferase
MSDNNRKHIARHPERGNTMLRMVDRFAGIPVVWLLGTLRRHRSASVPNDPREVAFLQTAAIGDTVLSSAIVQDWKHLYPNSAVTLFTGSSNYDIARLIPGVDKVTRLPVTHPLDAIRVIRSAGHFDVWLDFGAWPRINAILSWVANADLKVGFMTAGQHRHYVYDHVARHDPHDHEIRNYRRLLEAIGVDGGGNLPALRHHTSAVVNNRITVHMFPGGSRSYLKEWPEQNWVRLLAVLAEEGYEIFLTGADVDRDRALAVTAQVRNNGRISVVAGTQTMSDVVTILHSSRIVISVDTGIMHIASALGAALIALHGPTTPDRWGPLNANAVALQSGAGCAPCIMLGFESRCTDARCMAGITVDAVLDALKGLMKQEGTAVQGSGPIARLPC